MISKTHFALPKPLNLPQNTKILLCDSLTLFAPQIYSIRVLLRETRRTKGVHFVTLTQVSSSERAFLGSQEKLFLNRPELFRLVQFFVGLGCSQEEKFSNFGLLREPNKKFRIGRISTQIRAQKARSPVEPFLVLLPANFSFAFL